MRKEDRRRKFISLLPIRFYLQVDKKRKRHPVGKLSVFEIGFLGFVEFPDKQIRN